MQPLEKALLGTAIAFFIFLVASISLILSLNHYDDGTREVKVILDLKAKGYRFILPRDYFAGDNKGKIALLIHDIDFKLGGLKTFMLIETEMGVKSAFYPRNEIARSKDVYYWLLIANRAGFEVGYQYECLSKADGNMTLATKMFKKEIAWVQPIFSVKTTDYHGDNSKPNIVNFDLYNETLWHSFGLNEIYTLMVNCSYFSDTSNSLSSPPEPYRDLVIVQLHTDWTR